MSEALVGASHIFEENQTACFQSSGSSVIILWQRYSCLALLVKRMNANAFKTLDYNMVKLVGVPFVLVFGF